MSEDDSLNRDSRERLMRVVHSLGTDDIALEDGWTAAAALSHIAFWERVARERFTRYLRDGTAMEFFNPVFFDYINAAGSPQWLRTPLAIAAADAIEAARATDDLLERLTSAELVKLGELGKPNLFQRFPHRNQHLEQIERAVAWQRQRRQ